MGIWDDLLEKGKQKLDEMEDKIRKDFSDTITNLQNAVIKLQEAEKARKAAEAAYIDSITVSPEKGNANSSAVQVIITVNGKSITAKNNKNHVMSLKVSRIIGDAANKFNLEIFDETAWQVEQALYKSELAPISIQYGATGDWANGKHITFTGICTNYNLNFVGQATSLSIEGILYAINGVTGANTVDFWFKRETVEWVDLKIELPQDLNENNAEFRCAGKIDGKSVFGTGGSNEGYEDIDQRTGDYYDRTCARIEWIPPSHSGSDKWEYRPLINPTNIFKRIIRKYNGEIGNNWDDYEKNKFKIHPTEVDESLWIDASSLGSSLTQNNTTAADFITNTLCKLAVKPGSNSAGFNYYVKDGMHCFKAIDYNASAQEKIVKMGYFTKDSEVISFSVNQSGALVMAGAEKDKRTNEVLVDTSAIDSLTGQMITSEGYFAEGNYKAEKKMDEENQSDPDYNSTNWYFRKVSNVRVVSSSSQNMIDVAWGSAFDDLSTFPLSATLTLWGEYNNTYIPGNYIDLTVMTPDGHKHYSSGKYFILSADDSISTDGYTTTLKLLKGTAEKRNTFTSAFSAKKLKAGTYGYGGENPYSASSSTSSSYSSNTAKQNAERNGVVNQVWRALKGAGYSDIASAAVLGNIECESGFSSDLIEKGSGVGFGLCQWSYGRRTNLENYAKSIGKSAGDVGVQIDFLLAELTPGGGCNGYAKYQMGSSSSSKYDGTNYTASDWKDATDINRSTMAFMTVFERPNYNSNINHISRRREAANQYYIHFTQHNPRPHPLW